MSCCQAAQYVPGGFRAHDGGADDVGPFHDEAQGGGST